MGLRETYNAIAEDWHRDHQADSWWVDGTDRFVSFLKPGDSVLDAGCAAGTKTKYLIEKELKVTGIDFSENFIAIAKREVPSGRFFVLDLFVVDRLDGEFDGVFVQAVLLHIPKERVRECIERLVGKLKPGGYIYLAVKERAKDGPEEEMVAEKKDGKKYERFFSFYDVGELDRILEDLGLDVVSSDVLPSGHTRWIQVIGRKNESQ